MYQSNELAQVTAGIGMVIGDFAIKLGENNKPNFIANALGLNEKDCMEISQLRKSMRSTVMFIEPKKIGDKLKDFEQKVLQKIRERLKNELKEIEIKDTAIIDIK